MARVRYVSKQEADYRLYGAPTGAFDDFIEENTRRFMNGLDEERRSFFERTSKARDKWHGEEAIKKAKDTLRLIGSDYYQLDEITALREPTEIMKACPKMRYYILLNERVFREVKSKRMSGYGFDPSTVYESDRKHIRDGIVEVDEEEDVMIWEKVIYVEGYNDHLRLDLDEQCDILETHEAVLNYYEAGIDCTDKWNGEIKA